MFGRDEKLKRLEVENKLAEALEKLALMLGTKDALDKKLGEISHLDAVNKELHTEVAGLKGKIREQSESDAVLLSLRIIKAVVFDEKKKEDPHYRYLIEQQRAAMNQSGFLSQLGSLFENLGK